MAADPVTCPSAQLDMEGARVFGVVSGTPAQPRIAYLKADARVTPQMMAAHLADRQPSEVFRISARCEASRCAQFDGARCTLAQRIVEGLPAVVDSLPSCQIRATCRWWREAGREACLRCPQVTTLVPADQNALRRAIS